MTQYVFGTGQLFTTPVGGGAPLQFGALQDVSVDFNGDIKQLFGQYQFALDVARGKTKIEGKASNGDIDINLFNNLFFNQTVATGEKKQAINEAATIASNTFTVANAATFVMDLGVFNATTGARFRQVASAPAVGEYTVTTGGVYTFNASETATACLVNYIYTSASTGQTLEIDNQLLGITPKFQMVLSQVYNAKYFTLVLYSCVSDKFNLPLKQDDYTISEFSFQAQANAANQIGYITQTGGV